MQISPTQQVHVQMRNGLTRSFLAVDDKPVTFIETKLAGELHRHQMQMSNEVSVGLAQIGVGRQDFLGNDEKVNGGLRVDIMKGETEIVFMNDLRGDLLVDDLEKEVVGKHFGSSL